MVAGAATGLPLVVSASIGKVTVEASFRESITDRFDAVVVNSAQGSYVFNAKPWSTWADIEGSFDQWAEGIRKAIDRAHKK